MRPLLRQTIETVHSSRRALLAFNVQNPGQLDALTATSRAINAPAIAQISAKFARREASAGTLPYYLRLVRDSMVYLHLDHCDDPRLVLHCMRAGFDSVMFDGSAFAVAENIEKTNAIAHAAKSHGCLVEAELGQIGGVEDGHGSDAADNFDVNGFRQFCASVDATLLAPSIGNLHGFYERPEQVRLDLLPAAHDCLQPGQFLVLHGGTGLPISALRTAVDSGVVKVNISTALKSRTRAVLLDHLSETPLFDQAALSRELRQGLTPFYSNFMQHLTLPCSPS